MSSSGSSKHLKKDKDRISKLPDKTLGLILCFLSTKTAVKTSILSKRWKYLWTEVPALDFTKECKKCSTTINCRKLSLEQKIGFQRFVDKVLFHNVVSYVQRFCLDVDNADVFNVNSWLSAASKHEIRELDISFRWDSKLHISLPPRLLSGETLVVLTLKGHITLSSLMFSQLPNLETAHLYKLKFSDDESMRKLLSSCPVLKELHIVRCNGLPKVLYIESLILESLTIIQEINGPVSTCFAIKTPNVRYLCLFGTLPQYDLGDMCSLIEANLNVVYDDSGVYDDKAEKFLRNISRVQTLRLASNNFVVETVVPVFQNLTYLKQDADAFMCEMLKYTPKLTSLVIDWVNYVHTFTPEYAPKHLPGLESIEVLNPMGEDEDCDVLGYFLKAASALKEIKIDLHKRFSYNILTSIYKKLLRLPRSSAVCKVKMVKLEEGYYDSVY